MRSLSCWQAPHHLVNLTARWAITVRNLGCLLGVRVMEWLGRKYATRSLGGLAPWGAERGTPRTAP
jgi:hypothetical protein